MGNGLLGSYKAVLSSQIPSFFRKSMDSSFILTVMFIWLNVIYVTSVANFIEVGENMRYRFLVDPFYLILFGLLLNAGLKISRKRSLVSGKPPKHIP